MSKIQNRMALGGGILAAVAIVGWIAGQFNAREAIGNLFKYLGENAANAVAAIAVIGALAIALYIAGYVGEGIVAWAQSRQKEAELTEEQEAEVFAAEQEVERFKAKREFYNKARETMTTADWKVYCEQHPEDDVLQSMKGLPGGVKVRGG